MKEKRTLFLIMAGLCLMIPVVSAAQDNAKEEGRVKESGSVMKELVNSSSGVPISVLNKAECVIVLPSVKKAGFIVGAQGGQGILFMHGQPRGRYRTVAASYGLQAGVQKYGYALFLMNQKAVDWVNNTRGWEIGTGPSVVIVDKGMARSFSTDTLHSGIYAFIFDQQGLMAGLGLQGSKIMRID